MPEIQATGLSDAARAKIAAAAEAESRAGVGSATDITDAASGTPADNVFTRPGKEGSGGERAGETSAATGDTLPRPSGGTANEQVADATTVAGGGAATPVPPAGGPAGSMGKAAGASSSRDASVLQQSPPWSSPSWDADRAAAGEAIKSGRVPDAYRDVVSEYFRDGDDDRSGR
jgi:hypothetical protein